MLIKLIKLLLSYCLFPVMLNTKSYSFNSLHCISYLDRDPCCMMLSSMPGPSNCFHHGGVHSWILCDPWYLNHIVVLNMTPRIPNRSKYSPLQKTVLVDLLVLFHCQCFCFTWTGICAAWVRGWWRSWAICSSIIWSILGSCASHGSRTTCLCAWSPWPPIIPSAVD